LNLTQNLVLIIHVDEDVACAQIQAILNTHDLDVVFLIGQSF
jgi:2-keto-3-deoxy-L-rhamnonate aldolase RhmA